jgi:signal transduction histidine kinase
MDKTTLGPAPSREGKPGRRLLALALLLVLSLSLGAGLALQAIGTARRHRETTERTLEDYAAFAAFILASQTYRQLGGSVVETFTSWPTAGKPASNSLPRGTVCPAGTTWLEQAPGKDVRLSGAVLTPGNAAFLQDTLRSAMQLLEEVGWRFRFLRAPSATADGYFFTSYKAASGGYGLRGFSVCLAGDDSPFRRVMLAEHALPPSVTGSLPADSLFSVTVTAGRDQGQPLFASPVRYASQFHGSGRLGTEFGDLTLRLELRPDVAGRLVIGGIPASPTPLALGLLGLSTLLVVTALLQLRREYDLIAIRSGFVSNVSHELRTPLSQILIFTELLKLGRLRSTAERERALEIIEKETRRLIQLVENVLQFSRSGLARRRVEREILPLATLVKEALDAFRPLADAREVTLRADVPPQASVRADPGALRQILLNLLDNAVKYGPRGQTVSVAAVHDNGRVRIAVEDQGPGIPSEDRERVWKGYYRLQREAGSAVAGSGIGLAVVQSLTTDMGGRSWIEESTTGGARFVVELDSGEGGSS